MSAFVICRRLARRARAFPQYYKDSLWPRQLHRPLGKPEAEADEQGKRKEATIPGLCHFPKKETNHYSVASSHHLSSTENKRLDLAVNKASEDKTPPQSFDSREAQSSEEDNNNINKHGRRAFRQCRPIYAAITLDRSRKQAPIEPELAFLLLHKVAGPLEGQPEDLKGCLKMADVTKVLRMLGHLRQEHKLLVRSDVRFDMLLQYVAENLRLVGNRQLLRMLKLFVWLELPATHGILQLFESEMIQRAPQMSFHQLLLAADVWHCLRKHVPQFLKQLYDSVHLSLHHVGVAEFVQLLYMMGEGRHCPKYLVNPIEQLLMRHLRHLQPDEVSAVCLGLFKSQTSLSKTSVSCLVDHAHCMAEEMSDFAIVNVFKLLRFSYLDHLPWLKTMGEVVPRRAPGMSVMGMMHVALACSALHYRDDSILMSVAGRLPSVVHKCRSKDSCKLLWSFGSLGVLPSQCPEVYCNLVEVMRRKKAEFQLYPEHLLTGLLGLAFVGQFPEDLLALALSPEFVSQALKCPRADLSKDLCTIDGTVGLELPDWTGPRLDVTLREEIAEKLRLFALEDLYPKPEFLEAEKMLRELLGGKEFVSKTMILPHTRSFDLVIHLDSTGNPLPVNLGLETTVVPEKSLLTSASKNTLLAQVGGVRLTEDLVTQLAISQKTVEPAALSHQSQPHISTRTPVEVKETPIKLAVQVYNRNHCCYHSEQLMGFHVLKRRHLQLAGYRVVELNYNEWIPLLRKCQFEKLSYLHCKIYQDVT